MRVAHIVWELVQGITFSFLLFPTPHKDGEAIDLWSLCGDREEKEKVGNA